VDGEVDLGQRLLVLYRADSIVDLHVLGGALVGRAHHVGVLGVHGGRWLCSGICVGAGDGNPSAGGEKSVGSGWLVRLPVIGLR
jgi:hypothetical protein